MERKEVEKAVERAVEKCAQWKNHSWRFPDDSRVFREIIMSELDSLMGYTTRTLVRVVELDEDKRVMRVVLPGWDPNATVDMPFHTLSRELLEAVRGGTMRLHVKANLAAEQEEDLRPFYETWELE